MDRKESLSLFSVEDLILASACKLGFQSGIWDPDLPEVILSSGPLLFFSLLELTIAVRFSLLLLSLVLQVAVTLAFMSTAPSSEKQQQAEYGRAMAWILVIPQKAFQEQRGLLLPLLNRIALIHWKWIRFGSRITHIRERQRKRSWDSPVTQTCSVPVSQWEQEQL